MATIDGIQRVLRRTNKIFERRRAALYALSLEYAERALNEFRRKQIQNAFWTNRTRTALELVFSDAYIQKTSVGWFIAHGVEYGVHLELANNGEHQALRLIIEEFTKPYFDDAKQLYKD